MAAEHLNTTLARNANNLAGTIYKTTINRSVWNKLVPKEAWIDGVSDTQKVLTVERNLAPALDTWTDITPNSDSNTCAIAGTVVPRGSTERSFHLIGQAIESGMICVNDTRNAYMVNQQIAREFEILRDNVSWSWRRLASAEYFRVSENKVVATAGLQSAVDHMPAVAATSVLTQKMLNKFYQELIQNSAEIDGGSLGMNDGRPTFILVTDAETSDSIMREDGTNAAFLWNNQRVPELLAPLGVERAFRGFYHTIDNLPRRYTFSGGVWTEVLPYTEVSATTGTKRKLSAAYMAAPFQDSYIYVPTVMSMLHPGPISTVGSQTQFVPQSYVGDFKWLNVQNVDSTSPKYNPDNSLGFYRAVLQSATKPIAPQFGYVIRHLRCPSDIGLTACPDSTAGDTGDLGTGDYFKV